MKNNIKEFYDKKTDKLVILLSDIGGIINPDIEKISKFGKSFRVLTLDTVKTFYKDASEANFKI